MIQKAVIPVNNNTMAVLALFREVTGARTKAEKDRKVWFMSKQKISGVSIQ